MIIAAFVVALVAKVISSRAGIVLGTFLLFFVGFLIIKGVLHLIGAPDEEDYEDEA